MPKKTVRKIKSAGVDNPKMIMISNECDTPIQVRLYTSGFLGRGEVKSVTTSSSLISAGCTVPFYLPPSTSFFDRFQRNDLLISKLDFFASRQNEQSGICRLPDGKLIGQSLQNFVQQNANNFALVQLTSENMKSNKIVIGNYLFRQAARGTITPCPANAPLAERFGETNPICVAKFSMAGGSKTKIESGAFANSVLKRGGNVFAKRTKK